MISCDGAALVLLRRPEIVGVPWCFDPVADEVKRDTAESTEDGHTNADASVQLGLEEDVCFDHDQERPADEKSDEGSDIAFAAILSAVAAHKVL